ncbi:hypothetical protein ME763_37160 (plasmid) [Streptomyces murinus]|uniref:hypothetical protein n=1 Tax=Streptomyces murinus TaxID=33900 RepID=UPI00117C8799|nr:hypothetical protein [Streptomyces murinus]WDO11354.1 hypothetical protein ME763_37160 [Streptomyces murinus]
MTWVGILVGLYLLPGAARAAHHGHERDAEQTVLGEQRTAVDLDLLDVSGDARRVPAEHRVLAGPQRCGGVLDLSGAKTGQGAGVDDGDHRPSRKVLGPPRCWRRRSSARSNCTARSANWLG